MLLRLLEIPRREDQDYLGWIWEVSPQSFPRQYVLHVLLESLRFPSRSSVVHIPQLRELGVCSADLTDDQEYSCGIGNHS